jgi:hypothetical protein
MSTKNLGRRRYNHTALDGNRMLSASESNLLPASETRFNLRAITPSNTSLTGAARMPKATNCGRCKQASTYRKGIGPAVRL